MVSELPEPGLAILQKNKKVRAGCRLLTIGGAEAPATMKLAGCARPAPQGPSPVLEGAIFKHSHGYTL